MKYTKAIRAAFPHTVPVLTGYLFLGTAFGILLSSKGYGVLWALLMSVCIYAGSMQFVAAGLLAGGFEPVQALLLTLMVNARHVFYGLAMLERFGPLRRGKAYMIFALTDETFSLLCSVEPPEDVPPGMFDLCLSGLNQLYWVAGSALGAVIGTALPLNTRGIEFVMTALFTVIFLQQWQTKKGRVPALIGVGTAVLCRIAFGAQWFILPTMGALITLLPLLRRTLTGGDAQ